MSGFVPPTDYLRTPQEDPVASQELLKGVTHGIASFPDADGFHHARVAQLTHAEISVEELRDVEDSEHTFEVAEVFVGVSLYHGSLVVIRFDAADKVRLACSQRFHQGVERLTELSDQGRDTFLRILNLLR